MDHPALARRCLGLVFLYHGLVPKLLLPDPLELSMIAAHPLPGDPQLFLYLGAGLEILLGLLLLSGRARWPLWVAGGLLVLLLLDVALLSPRLLAGAFNPVSLNLSALALTWIALDRESPAPHASSE